jgi:hypothetical protein
MMWGKPVRGRVTTGALLEELTGRVGEAAARSREWPKKPNALANRLRRLAPNLRKAGIDVVFDREPGGKRTRVIRLACREENAGGEPSRDDPGPPGPPHGTARDGPARSLFGPEDGERNGTPTGTGYLGGM